MLMLKSLYLAYYPFKHYFTHKKEILSEALLHTFSRSPSVLFSGDDRHLVLSEST